jgi:adenylate cyclase class 2
MKDIEIELKFEIPSLALKEEILNFLQNHATLVKETFQKDTYFLPSHKDFFAVKPPIEWLRIRESDKGNSINYKHWQYKDGVNQNYCDEYESSLGDSEAVEKILTALDIQPLVVVDKKRKVFQYKKIEVSIDEVENLGNFIELEAHGEFESIEVARDSLYALAKQFKLEHDEQKTDGGYAYMLLKEKGLL